jgi:HSP20 family protein
MFDLTRELSPFGRNHSEVNRLMGGAFPALNVREDAQAFHVEAEVPGLKLEDVEVTFMDGELSIRGERKDLPVEGAEYHLRERRVGSFGRTVRLPVDVDADRILASMEDGILTLTLPKAEAAKPRKISVQRK